MKSDSDAQKILLLRSSLPVPESDDGRATFDEILQRCGGLPIALSLAGEWIRELSGDSDSNEGVWKLYLRNCVGSVWDESDIWMKDSVVRSLKLADKETNIANQFSFHASFHSFSIMREQQKVPFRIFERLWKLSETDTVNAMKTLKRFSVVDILPQWKGQGMSVTLHDRILDVSRTLSAEQGSGEPRPSRTLIDSYTNYIGPASPWLDYFQKKCFVFKTGPASLWLQYFQRNWRSVFDDEFISENLFRLLTDAGQTDAAIWLTQEPAWIIKQLSKNGVFQVLKDFRIVEQYLQSDSDMCILNRDEKQSYRKFLNVVREICVVISNSDWEPGWEWYPWFQLYGRMRSYSGEMVVETFLGKIERDSPRPWLKPGLGCLRAAGTMSQTMISLDGDPLCQVEDNEEVVVVYKTAIDGCKLARYNSLGDLMFDVVLEEGFGVGGSDYVDCATYSVSKGAVTLGMSYKEVKIWRLSNANINSMGVQEGNQMRRDSQGGIWVSTVLRGNEDWVNSVAMSADGGRVVSGSDDGTVRVWKMEENGWEKSILKGHQMAVMSVAISEDGAWVVSGSGDCTVRAWKAGENGWESILLRGHKGSVFSVAISANGGRVVSGSEDETVRLWDAGENGWESTVLGGYEVSIWSVAISADGAWLVSGSEDWTVRVWKAGENGWESIFLRGHEGPVKSVVISAEGARVVSGSKDKTVRVWDAGENGWEPNVLKMNKDGVNSVVMSNDGARVVSVSHGVRVWDTGKRGWEATVLGGHEEDVFCVAISGDGRRVVSGSDVGTVRVWDTGKEGWESNVLGEHEGFVCSVAISGDGTRIVSGLHDKTVRMWKSEEKVWEETVLKGHEGHVRSVAISANGSRVVSGSDDKTVRVWNVGETGIDSIVLSGHEKWVWSVAISADGGRIVSGADDKMVWVWEWQGTEWKGKVLGKCSSTVEEVNIAHDSGVITAHLRNVKLHHWKDDRESWVEVGTDENLKSGLLTKSQLKKICGASFVYKTSSGFCVRFEFPSYIGFVDWID